MIRVFRCEGKKCVRGGPELLPETHANGEYIWIDLEAPTEEEERLVFEKFFKVHTLTLEDICRPRLRADGAPHFPKVEEFPNYLFVVVNPLSAQAAQAMLTLKDGERMNTQLSAVLTHTLLITHHYEPLVSTTELHSHLAKHDAHAERGPDFMFHLILDRMVDQYVPVLDEVDRALDVLETEVFTRPGPELLSHLLNLKHRVIALRKTMVYEREVLSRLYRGEFAMIDEREMVYYRNVYDHIVRFTELIEASREMVTDLMQTLLAAQANKLNEIMKLLTMISTTILPMSLVAGIYGMNYTKNVVPDFASEHGFMIALGIMLLSGLGAFALFRWKKWL